MHKKILCAVFLLINTHLAFGVPEDHQQVPGTVIDYSPAKSGIYLGCPSIVKLPNGDYIASHSFFGPKSSMDTIVVFRSKDKGKTWEHLSDLKGQWWSNLFLHGDSIYIMGVSKKYGDVVIRRSDDGGKTWTEPKDNKSGLLLEGGGYHTAPVPIAIHNGRIWRAMEFKQPKQRWGKFYSFVMSAPVDADLLNSENWTSSDRLIFDKKWAMLESNPGWLEGNIAVAPDKKLVNILRLNTDLGEKAAMIHISDDAKTISFDPKKDIIDFPGGATKFTIRFDPVTKRYYSLTNKIVRRDKSVKASLHRSTLALISSANLKTWRTESIIFDYSDVKKIGFQYIDWQFDGDDIIFVSRTAFEDGIGGAHRQHDANYFTFHRITNFRIPKAKQTPPQKISAKVGQSAEKSENAKDDNVNLIAARGEYESAQIVLRTETDINDITISVTDLRVNKTSSKSQKPIHAEDIQIRSLEKIKKWHDVLVPTKIFDIKAGQKKVIWLTVFVPRNIHAGSYSGMVTVKAAEHKKSIPVNVKVANMIIPVTPAIPAVFGIHDKMFQDVYHLGNCPHCLENEMDLWYQFLMQYRISPYFCDWLEKSMKHHSYPSPWEIDDPRTLEYLTDPRLSAFSIPYHTLDEDQLRFTLKYLKDHGLLDKGYFYLWDEPDEIAEYEHVAKCARQIHSIEPKAKVLVTYTRGPKDGPHKDDLFAVPSLLRGSAQIFCMSTWASLGKEETVKKIQQQLKPDEQWWSYVCMGPGNPHPNFLLYMSPIQHRAVMWRVWKENGTGFLYWAVNRYGKESSARGISFKERLPKGDGVLLYPGKPFAVEGPLASARLERFRDGFEDYEYLKAFEEKYGRDQAQKMLKIIYNGPTSYTNSPKKIETMRRKILEKM